MRSPDSRILKVWTASLIMWKRKSVLYLHSNPLGTEMIRSSEELGRIWNQNMHWYAAETWDSSFEKISAFAGQIPQRMTRIALDCLGGLVVWLEVD